ncbi:uncharacterized protein EKO05_0008477 [Ascochyta rabiei]|uniref:uncharacterized protein n=1 Tax=Didymella rabiei TaxID=5454 RepID=UPI0021FEEAA9|nr:uncharacterized protein EKO05_0008477 [Ascochyta rabiei]UPX18169.1 hypothetical protein EKO05_0008477 [Ascochyta rabiei]
MVSDNMMIMYIPPAIHIKPSTPAHLNKHLSISVTNPSRSKNAIDSQNSGHVPSKYPDGARPSRYYPHIPHPRTQQTHDTSAHDCRKKNHKENCSLYLRTCIQYPKHVPRISVVFAAAYLRKRITELRSDRLAQARGSNPQIRTQHEPTSVPGEGG